MDSEQPTTKSAEVSRIFNDFWNAYSAKRKWLVEAEEDYEFTLGKMWDKTDVDSLNKMGIRALTINKIRPNVWLLKGIEAQNRTDYMAYPEGGEDTIVAEIVTRLLKNAMKNCDGDYKISEMFESGLTCGESFLEPYIDYTYDLLNGKMQIKKLNFKTIYPDPTAEEYDLSDGRYMFKLSQDLTYDELLQIFPDKEKELKRVGRMSTAAGLGEWAGLKDTLGIERQTTGYEDDESGVDPQLGVEEEKYDLLEYYYKKYVKKYFVLDKVQGTVRECVDKDEADRYINFMREQDPSFEQQAYAIERMIPEIWIKSIVGTDIIDDSMSWSYPNWKGFPIISYYVYRTTEPIKNKELKVQGITRGIKDLNFELNKRRTQELRILNSSANSGWLSEQGAFVDKAIVKKYGSSPGILLEYKKGWQKPEKLNPTPLSQGHAQLAAENTQDIKESSGINTDLLSMNEKQASGRAIHLRTKQGLVMVQGIYDNLSQTKRMLGRFIVSQLGELYTIDTAVKVCGDQFLHENFSKPVMKQDVDPQTGQPAEVPVIDPSTGELQMELDNELIGQTFNRVLNDSLLGQYDVSVGEGTSNETIKYANFTTLMEMLERGIPIPPDVIIEESMISAAHKEKIARAIEKQQEMAAQAQPPA